MPKIGTSTAFVFFGGQVLCLQGINVSGSREWRGGGGEPPLRKVLVLSPERTINFDSFLKELFFVCYTQFAPAYLYTFHKNAQIGPKWQKSRKKVCKNYCKIVKNGLEYT